VFDIVEAVRRIDVRQEPACGPECAGWLDDEWHEALFLEAADAWPAERVGFWPVFLGVGENDDARYMTNYDRQWQRESLRRGPPHKVLSSWVDEPPELRFCDYMAWHYVLNSIEMLADGSHQPRVSLENPAWIEEQILGTRRTAANWCRHERRGVVQGLVPRLDLRTADEIWAPNRQTARALRCDEGDSNR
jgi:hypothetical protein